MSDNAAPILDNKHIFKGASITDMEGFSNAYSSRIGVFVNGDTLFISGTHTARDVFDDITTIPFSRIEKSERYQQALQSLAAIPTIKTGLLVIDWADHSRYRLKKQTYLDTIEFSRVYGAPSRYEPMS